MGQGDKGRADVGPRLRILGGGHFQRALNMTCEGIQLTHKYFLIRAEEFKTLLKEYIFQPEIN